MQPEDDPEDAIREAGENGCLVAPSELSEDEHWSEVVYRFEQARHEAGRAGVIAIVDSSGAGTVHYVAPGKSFAGPRLEAHGQALAEEYSGPDGFASGPFGSWSSRELGAEDVEKLVARLCRLDRFARDEIGARAFEKGDVHAKDWELAAYVMNDEPLPDSR